MATPERVQLAAPLAPNINHNETVFGGSAAALATLPPGALLHLRSRARRMRARLVIQRSSMEYERPIPGDFEAVCRFADESAWERFRPTLVRRGRARLTLACAPCSTMPSAGGDVRGGFRRIESRRKQVA